MTPQEKFFHALRDVFVGAKVEGESGYINLMKIKARYFEQGVFPQLQKDIDAALAPFPEFRGELLDKLYDFFHRYFSESGSIYFRYTPLHRRIYEQVYTDDRDVILFWKTHMLYYVKTDRLFQSMTLEVDGQKFRFDASKIEHKKANEKRELIYAFQGLDEDAVILTVSYTKGNTKTKEKDILQAAKENGVKLDAEALERAIRLFERQSEVDYFINKDARAFLREQFKLWMFQYLFDGKTIWDAKRIRELQTLEDIAFKIIEFIAQFEDELVKVWNKPKFVLNSHYIITLDKIMDKDVISSEGDDSRRSEKSLLDRIWAHPNLDAQIAEWRELGMIKEDWTPKDISRQNRAGRPVRTRYQFLPLDTKFFPDFEQELLTLFENLDEVLDGWLVHSDNHQALETLKRKFQDRVQTIYIDPPFNLDKDADFMYSVKYKDSAWISLLENRLRLASEFLAQDGSIFVRCDVNGNMYVRLLLEEIFGKDNFGNEIIINRFRRQLDELTRFNIATDTLFYATKSPSPYFRTLFRKRICSFCGQPIPPAWRFMSSPGLRKPPERVIKGRTLLPPRGRHWTFTQTKIDQMDAEGRIRIDESKSYVDIEGNRVQGLPEYLQTEDTPVDTVWTDLKGYVFGSAFPTENPEELLLRVLEVSAPTSEVRPIVMDFFLGSGTTIAVAHKSRRKWIGIELGDHFNTHVIPRMKWVFFGENTGVSELVEWKGGGFCKYFDLEQYEDTLRQAKYGEDDAPLLNIAQSPYTQYVFLRDAKMLDAVELDAEGNAVKVDLTKLYPNIDVAETLSCVTGKPIKRITADVVEFADGTTANLHNPDWKICKPLIWW